MSLELSLARPKDVARIAEIHLAAFNTNPLLHAQFPTPRDLANLEIFLAEDTLKELADANTEVLIVKDREQDGKIISFAKWTLPSAGTQILHEDLSDWPPGCVVELLREYYQKAEEVKRRIIVEETCYRLAVLATDPGHERKGAASKLLKWGIHRSTQEGIPVYLESTIEAAPLYESHGFKGDGGFSIILNNTGENGGSFEYQETSYVLRPPNHT